jgi:hypothetical protein
MIEFASAVRQPEEKRYNRLVDAGDIALYIL